MTTVETNLSIWTLDAGRTDVARPNWLRYKISHSPNFFWKFFFPNSVLLCFFLWTVEWIHDPPPLQIFPAVVICTTIRGMAFANGQGIVACLPFPVNSHSRVEFLLKTESGYLRDAGVT